MADSSLTGLSLGPPTTQKTSKGPGPPPDLSARFKLKAKYAKLQAKYARAQAIGKDLTIESKEKDSKVQRLQDEVNLIIDQIYDTDYRHLIPANDNLFSDSEDHVQLTARTKSSNVVRVIKHATTPDVKREGAVETLEVQRRISSEEAGVVVEELSNGGLLGGESVKANGNGRIRKEREIDVADRPIERETKRARMSSRSSAANDS